MNADANVRVVLEVFAAIAQHDAARFLAHTHPQVSICWPPSLPRNDGLPGRPDKHRHHFDTDAVKRFLADVQDQQPARRPSGPPAAGR